MYFQIAAVVANETGKKAGLGLVPGNVGIRRAAKRLRILTVPSDLRSVLNIRGGSWKTALQGRRERCGRLWARLSRAGGLVA
ncbi:MAG: hypothetical protein ACE5FS_13720, partial [Paracoccaceae bacterium]